MNPELQRNLWLEVTVHRLVLIPVVILAVAYLSREVLAPVALFAFVIVAGVWGTRQAAQSVFTEARERTWDIQRMSSLDPWTMTWGKHVGSTVAAWYTGLLCLVLYLLADTTDSAGARLRVMLIVTAGAVALQGAAMMGALAAVRLVGRINARTSTTALVILLILLLPKSTDMFDEFERLQWYGTSFATLDFWAASMTVFALWGVVAAYRAMCTELQVRAVPWVWVAFMLFMGGYGLGFAPLDGPTAPGMLAAAASVTALFAAAGSYLAAFVEPRDPVDYRRVVSAMRDGRARRALEELPLWVPSAVLAFVAAALCAAIGSDPQVTNTRPWNLGAVALSGALMMLRDVAILMFFSFGSRPRRAAATTLVYLIALDALVPALLEVAELHTLRALFLPDAFTMPWTAAAVFATHAAIAVALAARSWHATMPDTPPVQPPAPPQPTR